MKWRQVDFESLFSVQSRNGIYKPKEHHGSGVSVVNMGELFGFNRIGNQPMSLVQMTDAEMEKSGLIDGDLLFGRRSLVEEGAGKCSIVFKPNQRLTFESSIIRVRLDRAMADPEFYFNYFRSPIGRSRIRAIVSGATVKGIRGSDLKLIKVHFPPFAEQVAIRSVIETYDNLIATNQRRITLLEDAARRLYCEWFVNLRFPGHESVPVKKGVPEGWSRKPIKDFVKIQSGFAFKSEIFESDGAFGLVTIRNVHDGEFLSACDSSINLIPGKMPPECSLETGDILVSLTGNVGRCCLVVGNKFLLNQRVAKLIPKKETYKEFIYLLFRADDFKKNLESISNGEAQQNLSPIKMGNLEVAFANDATIQLFSEQTAPLIGQMLVLKKQNDMLAQARDLLLPKLMSGQLDVSGITLPEEAPT